jgi:hypothetical protein
MHLDDDHKQDECHDNCNHEHANHDSGKGNCDCWHCEMFGDAASALLDGKSCNTYSANAERLRSKLEKKKVRYNNNGANNYLL